MGTLYGFISVLFMSSVPVMNKFVVMTISPLQGALANCLISTFFFGLVNRFMIGKAKIAFCSYSIKAGILNAIGLALLYMAIQRVHPVAVGVMGRLGIVFAMAMSGVFLRQKPAMSEIILGSIAILGAFISAWSDLQDPNANGLWMALASTASFTASNFCLKAAARKNSNLDVLTHMNFFSTLLLGAVLFLSQEHLHIPNTLSSWALIVGATLVGSCLGFWFLLLSLNSLSFSMATILRATGPLFTALIAYPFFGFDFNALQIGSALFIMLAIVGLAVTSPRPS